MKSGGKPAFPTGEVRLVELWNLRLKGFPSKRIRFYKSNLSGWEGGLAPALVQRPLHSSELSGASAPTET